MKSKQEAETHLGCIQAKRQTKYLRPGWEWVETSIWTENMLRALDNGVKGGKWFSLVDKVYSPNTLELAWEHVKANKGAAGVDGISIRRFQCHAAKYLEELHQELKEDRYKPNAVKRVYIPKGHGKQRPLGIPTVKDRVVQTAVKMVIEPILEKEFRDMSYGFRPGKGSKDALREVQHWLNKGYTWVVDADLESYFDNIPHKRLMEKLERYISDGRILKLIDLWLKQDIMDDMKKWSSTKGSPQGAVISPLLANLYLHDLDVLMTDHGIKMIRYADDFVILATTEKQANLILQVVQTWTQEEGLTLHPEKTHLGDYLQEGQGFDFLGYRFENGKRWIRNKSIQKFRDSIRRKTKRTCGKSIEYVIEDVNRTLKGWYQYFKHVNKWGLETFDSFVRRRLRAILRKHEKRPGFGLCLQDHLRWPNAYFANLGLFTMEKARVREVAARSR